MRKRVTILLFLKDLTHLQFCTEPLALTVALFTVIRDAKPRSSKCVGFGGGGVPRTFNVSIVKVFTSPHIISPMLLIILYIIM